MQNTANKNSNRLKTVKT